MCHMPEFRRTAALTIVAATVLGACGRTPSPAPSPDSAADPASALLAHGFDGEVRAGVARLRAVTAPYHTLDSAVAAGYAAQVAKCYTDTNNHHGAMGYHHLNRAHVDSLAEPDKPEILLYERLDDGRYQLTGVEYIIPYRIRPREATPPRIFGLEMKQEDDLRLWYMHAWVWKENPAGLFADWNPGVKCPPD
jgi:hypothetical protein